jgi:CRISPR-associated protein Cas4
MSPHLLPVRMLNEYAYCPRLFALEWPNQEWAESADTVEGTTVHRRVDRGSPLTKLPFPEVDPDRPVVVRSLDLGDAELGLVAKIDLVEADAGDVIPVDYKRGATPDLPERAYEPERVQVCAQILLLRAHGYSSPYGVLYFAASRQRVRVEPTDELIAITLRYRDEARAVVADEKLPPPLIDSPKCPRCSLVAICLPDEVNLLIGKTERVRPMMPPRDDGMPMYVQ